MFSWNSRILVTMLVRVKCLAPKNIKNNCQIFCKRKKELGRPWQPKKHALC